MQNIFACREGKFPVGSNPMCDPVYRTLVLISFLEYKNCEAAFKLYLCKGSGGSRREHADIQFLNEREIF